MYQSVMAKRQGSGSSGTGFSFVLVEVREVHPDKNICLARDVDNNASYYELGLNKRGETAWPQVGDRWIIDRSMGHWALSAKVTDTQAPEFTGNFAAMDADLLRLVTILKGLGLVKDATTAGTLPVGVWQVVGDTGKPAFTSPWVVYNDPVSGLYQNPRYILGRDGFVDMEGLAKTTSSVTGTSNIFTLPPGFRPPKHVVFSSLNNGPSTQQLEVLGTGVVRLTGLPAGTVTYASLVARFATF